MVVVLCNANQIEAFLSLEKPSVFVMAWLSPNSIASLFLFYIKRLPNRILKLRRCAPSRLIFAFSKIQCDLIA